MQITHHISVGLWPILWLITLLWIFHHIYIFHTFFIDLGTLHANVTSYFGRRMTHSMLENATVDCGPTFQFFRDFSIQADRWQEFHSANFGPSLANWEPFFSRVLSVSETWVCETPKTPENASDLNTSALHGITCRHTFLALAKPKGTLDPDSLAVRGKRSRNPSMHTTNMERYQNQTQVWFRYQKAHSIQTEWIQVP